jgi:NAD(P)-dependent dehydrogenase (short-subunit alcohol dehydrogenase family)
MTRALAANGAHKIYILGRRLEVLEKAAAEYPDVIIPHQADVTSKEDLQAAVNRVKSEVGYVNLVVVNSGSIGPPVRFNPAASLPDLRQSLFTDFSMEGMNDALSLNVTAAFFTMTAFLELLDAGTQNSLKGGFGKPPKEGSDVPSIQSQIIFTTSISAFSRHWTSSPQYLTSKVAIMQVAKHASTQLARFGIRVNAIAPGSMFFLRTYASMSILMYEIQFTPRILQRFSFQAASPRKRPLTMIASSQLAVSEGMRKWQVPFCI